MFKYSFNHDKWLANRALFQVFRFCCIVILTTFGVQFVFEKKVDTDALNYVIPVALASYFVGKLEGRNDTSVSDEGRKNKPSTPAITPKH